MRKKNLFVFQRDNYLLNCLCFIDNFRLKGLSYLYTSLSNGMKQWPLTVPEMARMAQGPLTVPEMARMTQWPLTVPEMALC